MKVTMVIPSYWTRESAAGWKEGDAVYDHPTPLDSEGTLLRAIESAGILEDKDFQLVIIAVANAEDIEPRVEKKVAGIIKSASAARGIETLLFGPSHLRQIHDLLIREDKKEDINLLELRGYSNVRNLCMFIPHILDSEVAILIDDDEVFEDPKFMAKAKEFIGRSKEGRPVNAVAGYYLQPDGGYRVRATPHPWMKHWDQLEKMNEGFDRFIGTGPRLKETPFVFGGNMVIHQNLFTVPFDPWVPRGEDIDFLINAKMFGFTFFLDNQLSIKHLPPPKTHPTWKRLREDIRRFIYERAKIEHQKDTEGMTKVHPEDFDPYPGCFLKRDLDEKIEKACRLLSAEYLARGDKQSSEETLKNIAIAATETMSKDDPFQRLGELKKRWEGLLKYTDKTEVRSRIREIIEGRDITVD
ncbi:MAG: hypothetical protein GXO98_00825 [Nitrospirae bacterium]|nr:hypothetical protein [Nitrospirota bacterium]